MPVYLKRQRNKMRNIGVYLLFLLLLGCSESPPMTCECEKNAANLRLFAHTLYPSEKIELWVDDNVCLNVTANKDKGEYYFERWFCVPANKEIRLKVITRYRDTITLRDSSSMSLETNEQGVLLISIPYPKKYDSPDPFSKYGYVPIDSSKRAIAFKKRRRQV